MTKPLPPDAVRKKAKSTTVPKAKTNTATNAARDPEVQKRIRTGYKNLSNLTPTELQSLDPDTPLTEKAKLFVKFWAQGESISSASARAGYADGASYAHRIAHTPAAKLLYQEEKRLYEEAAQISRKDVMDMLIEAYEMAKMTAEPSTMVAAAREVGKMCGYYDTKITIQHLGAPGGPQDMSRRSDEELMEMIRKASLPLPAPESKP
jgi:hypothetical protein